MPTKAKAAPMLAMPLDAAAEVQRLKAEASSLTERLAAAEKRADDAAAAAAAADKRAADAAAASTGGRPAGLHRLTLTERETATGIVGHAVVMLPNGRRFDLSAKRGSDGRIYVREDYEKRFVNDGRGGKRPTSGLDCDVAQYAYVQSWRVENPEILAQCATWAADVAAAAPVA